jgi:ABC-type branched-subunit amino acid transport system substrate-binding protein
VSPAPVDVAQRSASYATQRLKAKRSAVLFSPTPEGNRLANEFSVAIQREQGQVVLRLPMPKSPAEYGVLVKDLREKFVDAIYQSGTAGNGGDIAERIEFEGITLPVISGVAAFESDYNQLWAKSPPMARFVIPATDTSLVQKVPGSYGLYAYSAASVLLDAVEASKGDAVGQQLSNLIKARTWGSGTFRLSERGAVSAYKYGVWRAQEGQPVLEWRE